MWMILLYGVATFMELGLGCGCLEGCFQNKMKEIEVYIRILYALLLLTTYTFSDAYFSLNNFCKLFFCTMVIAFILMILFYIGKKEDAYFSLNNFCKLFFCTMVIAFILMILFYIGKKEDI
ncbi:hypothetical protein DWX80_18020, partial [Ruminococcus sp. AF21-3]